MYRFPFLVLKSSALFGTDNIKSSVQTRTENLQIAHRCCIGHSLFSKSYLSATQKHIEPVKQLCNDHDMGKFLVWRKNKANWSC